MAIVFQCDNCKKIIKNRNKTAEFFSYSEIFNKYNIPRHCCICEECLKPLAKYLAKFFSGKKKPIKSHN